MNSAIILYLYIQQTKLIGTVKARQSKMHQPFNHFLLILALSLLSSLCLSDSKTINIVADPWCPYNCDPKDEFQGIMVDIAKEALALSGFVLNYELLNWARAKRQVMAGNIDGIIGMSRDKDSEEQFFFPRTPVGESQICFYRRPKEDWQFRSVEDLINKKFGWINDYGFVSNPLDAWVKQNKNTEKVVTVAGKNVYSRLFQLLKLKRIDTFAEDRNVIAFELKQQDLINNIEIANCLPEIDDVYLAFSHKSEFKEIWANALDDGILKLHNNGRLDEILDHYGLTRNTWIDSKFLP